MFGRILLKPEIGREPIYDNIYNNDARSQPFTCVNCSHEVPLDVGLCIGADACDPESVLGAEHGDSVRDHFGILKKSLANGWPFVKVHPCPNCGCRYLVYVARFEPRNGWCQGVLQGITELVPSNKSLKSLVSLAGTGEAGPLA